jgi:uroporphyrinogen III methyltransferase / synthase
MGTVYLIGAGPGDPELLTVRAARLLRRAGIVIHDALIGPGVLDLVPPGAERIDVGKRCGGTHTDQSAINRHLVEAAARARVVVRLKGGDPFVFGRGGEEALALREAGIRFEVVPGVTAALGAAAYAGIPLTHRGTSSAVRFVTGHECAGKDEEGVDWQQLARSEETIVVYMGVKGLAGAAERLIRAGRSPLTPTAVIERGTYASQRTVEAPLLHIARRAQEAGIGTPALVVIGQVVALRRQIAWFERRPLHGLRILVPRPHTEPSRLASRLRSLGAEVVELPRVQVLAPERPDLLRDAVRNIAAYGWLVFTSPTAVERFADGIRSEGRDARALAGLRVASFGRATAAALRRIGIRADVAEAGFAPSAAAAAMSAAGGLKGARVLFPRNGLALSPLAARLSQLGARVDEVEAYREVIPAAGAQELRDGLQAGRIDVIAFSSSASVRCYVDALGPDVAQARVAAIGAETARTVLSLGLPLHVVPGSVSLSGMIRGIRENIQSISAASVAYAGAAPGRTRLAS